MTEHFEIPSEQGIEQFDPLYHNVLCQDGEERDVGGVRLPPRVLEEISADYPEDVLPVDIPAIEGVSPFELNKFDQLTIYEAVDFTNGHQLHGSLWTAILTENLDLPFGDKTEVDYQASGLLIGSFPEFYDVNQMSLYCPDTELAAMERLDTEHTEYIIYDFSKESIVRALDFNELDFYDVPDDVLLELLPEKYNSEVVSNTI